MLGGAFPVVPTNPITSPRATRWPSFTPARVPFEVRVVVAEAAGRIELVEGDPAGLAGEQLRDRPVVHRADRRVAAARGCPRLRARGLPRRGAPRSRPSSRQRRRRPPADGGRDPAAAPRTALAGSGSGGGGPYQRLAGGCDNVRALTSCFAAQGGAVTTYGASFRARRRCRIRKGPALGRRGRLRRAPRIEEPPGEHPGAETGDDRRNDAAALPASCSSSELNRRPRLDEGGQPRGIPVGQAHAAMRLGVADAPRFGRPVDAVVLDVDVDPDDADGIVRAGLERCLSVASASRPRRDPGCS